MSASANDLPEEIVAKILQYLRPEEVLRNRRVSRQWRDAVDSFPDKYWQRQCKDDVLSDDYKAAHSKYGLSWRGVYKALNSWDYIDILPMNIYLPPSFTNVNEFQVLPNGIIALVKTLRHKTETRCSDTIIYYNLETNEECGREEFDFLFADYKENKHFIVFGKIDETVCIITKHDKQLHTVPIEGDSIKYVLLDNEVYSFTDETNIVVSKMVDNDAKRILVSETLPEIEESYDVFMAVSLFSIVVAKKDGKLYVLASEGGIHVYDADENSFEEVSHISQMRPFDALGEYGINWRSSEVFNVLLMMDHKTVIDCFYDTFYGHGEIFISSKMRSPKIDIIDIRCNLFDMSLVVDRMPNRQVDMSQFITGTDGQTSIDELDIMETETHHKILALAKKKLYVVEFQYAI